MTDVQAACATESPVAPARTVYVGRRHKLSCSSERQTLLDRKALQRLATPEGIEPPTLSSED